MQPQPYQMAWAAIQRDGHYSSDGMGGYYTPDGDRMMSDGGGGYYTKDGHINSNDYDYDYDFY